MKVCLVYGGTQGSSEPKQACDYYRSPLFQFARLWASEGFDDWAVLSGINGVVMPKVMLPVHDYDLLSRSGDEVEDWARQVSAMAPSFFPDAEFTVIGPKRILDALRDNGLSFDSPLSTLKAPEQIRWLSERIEAMFGDAGDEQPEPAKRGPGRPRKNQVA